VTAPERGAGGWAYDLLVPAHRIVFAIRDGEVVEVSAPSGVGTFRAYRALPDGVHGMIAWPNTVLLTGPEPVVVDPGYQTQGDVLVGALAGRGLGPDGVRTVVMTHLHSDHLSALPQLGEVVVHVHAAELDAPYARRQSGLLDGLDVRPLEGDGGEILPGLGWVHTPGHSPGHIAVVAECDDGRVVIAGDTLGPDPDWFWRGELPEGFPDRDAHLAAFRTLRGLGPALVVPGHNPPFRLD
jgi:glyoxylase-like metal-dependent hydrolase (beta-lactamase superfamily II)